MFFGGFVRVCRVIMLFLVIKVLGGGADFATRASILPPTVWMEGKRLLITIGTAISSPGEYVGKEAFRRKPLLFFVTRLATRGLKGAGGLRPMATPTYGIESKTYLC